MQGAGWGQDLLVSVGLSDALGESEGPGQGLEGQGRQLCSRNRVKFEHNRRP